MDSLNKLIEYFREFPGIGPRQARRFAYFLLSQNQAHLEELAYHIVNVRKAIQTCDSCFRFFSAKKPGATTCSVCLDANRDKSTLMIVAHDVDFDAIEKSGSYRGLYFILGGTVPFLEKNPESRVRLRELAAYIEKRPFSEIILSLNANPEGEHTAETVRAYIKEMALAKNIRITILGRGLSTGSELEYTDADTINNALRNRA